MPFPATPSPFRLSRRNPSTRRNGPQFAPTPRFLLSQNARQNEDDDLEVLDDDGPLSTHQAARDPSASQSVTRSRQRDVIEDLDDVEIIRHTGTAGGRNLNELPDDTIDSSPPEEPDPPRVLDAEFDALFAPTRDSNKRRRVDTSIPLASRLAQDDPVVSSPFGTTHHPTDDIAAPDNGEQRTPAPNTRQFALPASTPGDARTKTPFRARPRFMLSSAAKPPSSQSATMFKPATPAISPPERRKPVFVLPRSPSPDAAAEDIPAPFSPSSRTLNRRGRNRGGVSNYIPGGMAAEVRGWVLEMGSKHEMMPKLLNHQALDMSAINASLEKQTKYFLTVRVVQVNQSVLSGCGCVAFLRAEVITGTRVQGTDSDNLLNIMVMGSPRSTPDGTPTLKRADVVGIYRGLEWSLGLDRVVCEDRISGQADGDVSNCGHPGNSQDKGPKELWLVAMEWDVVETA